MPEFHLPYTESKIALIQKIISVAQGKVMGIQPTHIIVHRDLGLPIAGKAFLGPQGPDVHKQGEEDRQRPFIDIGHGCSLGAGICALGPIRHWPGTYLHRSGRPRPFWRKTPPHSEWWARSGSERPVGVFFGDHRPPRDGAVGS